MLPAALPVVPPSLVDADDCVDDPLDPEDAEDPDEEEDADDDEEDEEEDEDEDDDSEEDDEPAPPQHRVQHDAVANPPFRNIGSVFALQRMSFIIWHQ